MSTTYRSEPSRTKPIGEENIAAVATPSVEPDVTPVAAEIRQDEVDRVFREPLLDP